MIHRNVVQGFHIEFEALEHEFHYQGSWQFVAQNILFTDKIPTGISHTQTDTTYVINLINLIER